MITAVSSHLSQSKFIVLEKMDARFHGFKRWMLHLFFFFIIINNNNELQ